MFFGFLLISSGILFGQEEENRLEVKPHYTKEAVTVVRLLDMYHFKKVEFEDSLSAVILDNYLANLDNGKQYFYESDISLIRKYYKHRIDDLTKEGNVRPAFSIYEVFEKRFDERMKYLRENLLDYEFDFTLDEDYETDREKIAWIDSEEEMNDLWRKIIKSQYLSLKLNGKEEADIRKALTDRYNNFEKRLKQYRSEDVFQLFMNQVAEAYDPHTNYFSPVTSERFRQNMTLSLEGIGARLVSENDYTKIVEIVPGGPAYKSNQLHPEDRIIGVGQGREADAEMEDVIGWRLDDVVSKIKGPKGTWVTLQIIPAESGLDGPTKLVTLQREKIKLEDQKVTSKVYEIRKDGKDFKMGVITVPGFYWDFEAAQAGETDYNSTTRDVKKILVNLKEQKVDGVLMDLRDNGGGSLKEAIDLTGLFIKKGPVVQVKNSVNKVDINEDEDPDITWDGPLTVMINRFSASASEIFAGAIQDYNRGVVIGEQSFGKGTVQTIIDLQRFLPREKEKLGQLKITFQKFYRVTGSSTQHLGVMPDITLPSAFDADEYGESSQPSALPWDQIKETKFSSTNEISGDLLASLNASHSNRLQNDPMLKQLVKDVNELRDSMNDTKISLNEESRKKERERRSKSGNDLGTEIVKEGELEDIIEIEDTYLREGVIVLSELVKSKIG